MGSFSLLFQFQTLVASRKFDIKFDIIDSLYFSLNFFLFFYVKIMRIHFRFIQNKEEEYHPQNRILVFYSEREEGVEIEIQSDN